MPHFFRTIRPLIAVPAAVFALAGCVEVLGGDPVVGEVSAQRRRWEAQRLDDYHFTVARSCFCPGEYTEPARVEVRDGQVARVVHVASARELDPRVGFTIDELFGRIEDAARDGTFLEVEYHSRRGYPVRATIGTLANDAGVIYDLSELEPLR